MHFLITGANGLVGSYLCRRLLEHRCRIRALRRASSDLGLVQDIQDQIEWVEGDILDAVRLGNHLQDITHVVHSAAFVSYDSRDENRMHKINVEGTANVVNACLACGLPHLLHVSSVAAVGKGKGQLVDEHNQLSDLKTTTAYARSKYLAELEVWRGISEGLPATIVNPSLVLGPGNWDRSSTQVFKYIRDEHRFYTDGVVNYVDVRDVAEVAWRLLKQENRGERYIVSAGSTTYQELFEKIAHYLHKKPPAIKVNPSFVRLASVADRWRAALTRQPRLVTDELTQISQNTHAYDNIKVKQATAIEFVSLDETIAWCCQQLTNEPQTVQ